MILIGYILIIITVNLIYSSSVHAFQNYEMLKQELKYFHEDDHHLSDIPWTHHDLLETRLGYFLHKEWESQKKNMCQNKSLFNPYLRLIESKMLEISCRHEKLLKWRQGRPSTPPPATLKKEIEEECQKQHSFASTWSKNN